jgi:hypothetical protein
MIYVVQQLCNCELLLNNLNHVALNPFGCLRSSSARHEAQLPLGCAVLPSIQIA